MVAVGDRRAEQIRGPAGPTSSIRAAAFTPNRCTSWAGTSAPEGLQPVLSPELTDLIERYLADDVNRFLAAHGLTKDDIGAWVSHPGGPKVIDAISQEPRAAPGGAGADLALAGRDRQPVVGIGAAYPARHHRQTPPSGSPGLMLAMGPGFCSELVLLRWH